MRCADALKASLACLFANVQGVMFMLTRFGTYNFSVRLRMPKAVRIEDAAKAPSWGTWGRCRASRIFGQFRYCEWCFRAFQVVWVVFYGFRQLRK